MRSSTLSAALAALITTTLAALPLAPATVPATTVTLLIPFGSSQTYLASVVTAYPSSTAYAVTCAPFTTSDIGDYCDQEYTITQGPSVWEWQYTVASQISASAHCEGDIENGPLTCTQSESGPEITGTDGSVQIQTLSGSDLEGAYAAVTITQGAESLTGGQTSATAQASISTEAASSASEASSKASSSKSKTGGLLTITGTASSTGSASGSATETATGATATSTGAAPTNMAQKGAVVGVAGFLLAALAL